MAAFVARATAALPAVLYGFNIADLARRNAHLGSAVGDADIAELEALLTDLGPTVRAQRTHGGRWLVLAPESACQSVEDVVARFARSAPFIAGWQMTATKDGHSAVVSGKDERGHVIRALRCLFAPVRTRAELEEAALRIQANDYALPVDRLISLADVASMERAGWQCVTRYPAQAPTCPLCGGREVDWTEGDTEVYSGDGSCRGCGARLALRDVSRVEAAAEPRNDVLEDLGFCRILPVAHYRVAIADEHGKRRLVSRLRNAITPGHPALAERRLWDLPLVDVRAAWLGEDAPSILVEDLPRGLPSTRARGRQSVPPFVISFAEQLADAHAAGDIVGELHASLVFVDARGELVACAQRPLRAEHARAAAPASSTSSTPSGMAPMFFERILTPREILGDHGAQDPRDDVFRLACMVWAWRHGASPFGADAMKRITSTLNGTPVRDPADDFDRLLVRGLSKEPRERPSAREIATALRALGAGWKLS